MACALAQLQGCAQLRLETAPALNSRVPTPAQRAVQWRRQQRRSGSGGLAAAAPRAMTVAAAPAARVSAEDKWIERTLEAVVLDSASLPAPLAALQSGCLSALATARMPTTRNEEYRFTDVSPVLQATLAPGAGPTAVPADAIDAALAAAGMKADAAATVVVVDGQIDEQRSSLGGLPEGVYVGGLAGAPQDVVSFALGAQSRARGGAFALLNGAAARDALVVHLPANVTLAAPIHILHLSSAAAAAAAGQASLAAPRLLAVLEEGASAEIVEEFASLAAPPAGSASKDAPVASLTTAVAEIELDDRAALKHSYVVLEGAAAAHAKATLVNQGTESSYSLTEVRVGGRLTRHDLSIEQLGEATQSQMRSFLLCGDSQLHDLHSKLRLDHPGGEANQLHKCIVSSPSGRGVFDGNVRVNRLAQKTDAQQLSRNLLLVPRATVNVKPNLQIIADDVKCTHGCTVSDLEEEELFYLKSRGISAEVARQMLVYSFGREVVQGLRDEALQARVEAAMRATLASFTGAPAQ